MPARDGRGPMNEGSMTGRGLGFCSSDSGVRGVGSFGRFRGNRGSMFGGGRRFGAGRFSDIDNTGYYDFVKNTRSQMEDLKKLFVTLKEQIDNIVKDKE